MGVFPQERLKEERKRRKELEKKLTEKGLIVHSINFKRSGSNPFIVMRSFIDILILYFRIDYLNLLLIYKVYSESFVNHC